MIDRAAVLGLAFCLAAFNWAGTVSADTVVAFGATWCGPCQQMKSIEQQLIAEHYDIRCVDIDKDKALAKSYRVGPIPCFVAVKEVSPGVWKETGRITGKCTAGQLRRLAVAPRVTTIGAAARGAVRDVCQVLEW